MDNIFISHIQEEAALAQSLKRWLGLTTAGQWQVFASSDKDNVTLGDKWFTRIDETLACQRLLIALCSPASLRRLWLGYEVGYASAKRVPIIPICHSGLKADALPTFLSPYKSIDIKADGFVENLYAALQVHVPLQGQPYIPTADINADIDKSLPSTARPSTAASAQSANGTAIVLDNEDCIEVLRQVATVHPNEASLVSITGLLALPRTRVEHYFDVLDTHQLVRIVPGPPGDMRYKLSSAGLAMSTTTA